MAVLCNQAQILEIPRVGIVTDLPHMTPSVSI